MKNATVTLAKAGLYRFDTQPAQIKVFKGGADVAVNRETVVVGAGKMLRLGAVASVEKFDVADTDKLDRWSHRRAEVWRMPTFRRPSRRITGGRGGTGTCMASEHPCAGYGGYNTGPIIKPLGTWGYNPYYGLGTYIPCNGTMNSPYGYRYWSP